MAHTKSGGSTKLGRDSASKRLGVKVNNEQRVFAGDIIIRQRGTRVLPGLNVKKGKDDTLYAAIAGTVKFQNKLKTNFNGKKRYAKIVKVEPISK